MFFINLLSITCFLAVSVQAGFLVDGRFSNQEKYVLVWKNNMLSEKSFQLTRSDVRDVYMGTDGRSLFLLLTYVDHDPDSDTTANLAYFYLDLDINPRTGGTPYRLYAPRKRGVKVEHRIGAEARVTLDHGLSFDAIQNTQTQFIGCYLNEYKGKSSRKGWEWGLKDVFRASTLDLGSGIAKKGRVIEFELPLYKMGFTFSNEKKFNVYVCEPSYFPQALPEKTILYSAKEGLIVENK